MLRGRTALITGASAGIGTAFARVLAERGANLVLTARRRDRLEALAAELEAEHGVETLVIPADLADPAAPQALFDAVTDARVAVDILVNNAGFGSRGYFRKTEWRDHAAFLQVLVTAVVHLTHLFEPGMVDRGYGRIINVASLAGLLPGSAGRTLYGAAKSFLIKFSEALTLEHDGDGLSVTAVCPGFTYSEFHDVVGNRDEVSRLPRIMWQDAATVAREGLDGALAGKPLVVNGAPNRALAALSKLMPERLALEVMRHGAKRTIKDS